VSRPQSYLTADRLERLEQQLTAEDRLVLKTVATLHLASGQQLERICFSDRTRIDPANRGRQARRRLGRLSELGLLSRLARRVGGVRAGSSGFLYALGPAGQRLVAGWHEAAPVRGRQAHEASRQFAAHRLAVGETYTRLVEGSHEDSYRLAGFEAEPESWRPFAGPWGQPLRLKPDAFAAVVVSADELLWFIEVDRGTVSTAALKRQLVAYLAYWRSGHRRDGVMPRVLWLVPDDKRVATLEALVVASGAPAGLFVVALDVDAIAALTDRWPSGRSS
jgi:Replication-relaxation